MISCKFAKSFRAARDLVVFFGDFSGFLYIFRNSPSTAKSPAVLKQPFHSNWAQTLYNNFIYIWLVTSDIIFRSKLFVLNQKFNFPKSNILIDSDLTIVYIQPWKTVLIFPQELSQNIGITNWARCSCTQSTSWHATLNWSKPCTGGRYLELDPVGTNRTAYN